MRRHSFVARLGTADRARVQLAVPDSISIRVDFLPTGNSLGHGLGGMLDSLAALGLRPNEDAIDFVLLAALVFCADTRVSRSTESQDGWTREIDLFLPVADVAKWTGLTALLTDALNFLTGDRWRLFVRNRPARLRSLYPSDVQKKLVRGTSVCLFSGGLDSFIGAVDLLAAGETPLFVSHYWDGTTSRHQTICFDRIAGRFENASNHHVRARVGFEGDLVRGSAGEDTQRSRSFLFLALGAVAADGLDQAVTIYAPENGLISLNVPLDPLRLGALSTRTMHPYFLARFSALLTELSPQVTLVNPYRHKTKGEMVAGCADSDFLKRFAKETMSCSHPNYHRYRGQGSMHCGRCVPCLIRRAALGFGFGSDETPYFLKSLRARPLRVDRAEGEDVRSFQIALARLAMNPVFGNVAIHIPGPLGEFQEEWPSFARTYAAGMKEVGALLRGVTTCSA